MDNANELKRQRTRDTELGSATKNPASGGDAIAKEDRASSEGSDYVQQLATSKTYGPPTKVVAVNSLNRPLFHVDLTSALQSAIANVEGRGSGEPKAEGVTAKVFG